MIDRCTARSKEFGVKDIYYIARYFYPGFPYLNKSNKKQSSNISQNSSLSDISSVSESSSLSNLSTNSNSLNSPTSNNTVHIKFVLRIKSF